MCLENAEEFIVKGGSGLEAHGGSLARLNSGRGFGQGNGALRVGLLVPPAKSRGPTPSLPSC